MIFFCESPSEYQLKKLLLEIYVSFVCGLIKTDVAIICLCNVIS